MWSYWIGNHQKINKVALKKLGELTGLGHFPTNRQLRHFEGRRGPDGIKIKSPGEHEPHAFYDPFDDDDNEIVHAISDHFKNLVVMLKEKNQERAAFEASWLAHSIVDGMTPAHHFPYESELAQLSADKSATMKLGEKINRKRAIVTAAGSNPLETLKRNWRIYGFKGLLVTHSSFEGGVAVITQPLSFKALNITMNDIKEARAVGPEAYFQQSARKVALMNMYEHFYRYGWTASLARQTRDELMPMIIKVVAVTWYLALQEAGLTSRVKNAGK